MLSGEIFWPLMEAEVVTPKEMKRPVKSGQKAA
jgi:hypothetical protein